MELYYSHSTPVSKPPVAIYQDHDSQQLYSALLFDIKSSESAYKSQLSKLLACCSPLRSPTTSGASSTKTIRRLIAHHAELQRLVNGHDQIETMGSFVGWCEAAIPIYDSYIKQFKLDNSMIDMEIMLKKTPLKRIGQLSRFLERLVEINASSNISMSLDLKVINQFNKLVAFAKDQNEKENLALDLNTFYFDKVKELDETYQSTASYFSTSQVLKRDYFKLDISHPLFVKSDVLVEVFQLDDKSVAICTVESVGRSLMFPPLKIDEFDIKENNSDTIVISKSLENGDVFVKFTCPDKKQNLEWNQIIKEMHNKDTEDFVNKHNNLRYLKNEKIGLGLHMNAETMQSPSPLSSLRRSTNLAVKHNSLTKTDLPSPVLSEVSPNVAKVAQLSTKEPKVIKLNSPTLPLSLNSLKQQNESTVSLPNTSSRQVSLSTSAHPPSLNIRKHLASSTSDLAKYENAKPTTLKAKRRKSIFNLFSKKSHNDEPVFEIVTKQSVKAAQQPPSGSLAEVAESLSAPEAPVEKTMEKTPSSMASLNRNIKNLSINTQQPTSNTKKEDTLPSPFAVSGNTKTSHSLTPTEEKCLATSEVKQVLTNACIVSKWNNNKWEVIGKEYENTMKFLYNTQLSTMALFTSNKLIPELLVPISHPKTSIRKSSALDLQIRCLQNIESTQLMMITIRCRDSRTIRSIMDAFETATQPQETESISASSSFGVFSDRPSNSTSMSSLADTISKDEIMSLGIPTIYENYGQHRSNSTLSLQTPTSASFTTNSSNCSPMVESSSINELLLKSDVKIKLHKMDEDGDWIPISVGKFNLYSNIQDPTYSKFQIRCVNKFKLTTMVKNSTCERLGKSGLRFNVIDEYNGDAMPHLLELRNSAECSELYELLQ